MKLTIEVTEIKDSWTSDDGKVTIWTVVTADGKELKTMSKAIGTVGFSGEVEMYTNQSGKQYIRQIQKDVPTFGSAPSLRDKVGTQERTFKADPEKQSSIQKQSTLSTAVEVVNAHLDDSLWTTADDKKAEAPKKPTLKERVDAILTTYNALYAGVFGEKTVKPPSKQPDVVLTEEETSGIDDIDLNEVFGDLDNE